MSAPDDAYEVGYGRPPIETRWKKGQSGNSGPKKRKPASVARTPRLWRSNRLQSKVLSMLAICRLTTDTSKSRFQAARDMEPHAATSAKIR